MASRVGRTGCGRDVLSRYGRGDHAERGGEGSRGLGIWGFPSTASCGCPPAQAVEDGIADEGSSSHSGIALMAFSPQIAPLERFALRDGSKFHVNLWQTPTLWRAIYCRLEASLFAMRRMLFMDSSILPPGRPRA